MVGEPSSCSCREHLAMNKAFSPLLRLVTIKHISCQIVSPLSKFDFHYQSRHSAHFYQLQFKFIPNKSFFCISPSFCLPMSPFRPNSVKNTSLTVGEQGTFTLYVTVDCAISNITKQSITQSISYSHSTAAHLRFHLL